MNDLSNRRISTLIQSDYRLRGGGTRSIKNRSGSCSLRVDDNVVTYDADVDQFDIEEEGHPNNSDEAIMDSDDDDDAVINSIANDFPARMIHPRLWTERGKHFCCSLHEAN